MKKAIIVLLLILLLGCQQQAKGVLEGSVHIGPICPVERMPPDPACQPSAETFQAWPIAVSRMESDVKIATIVAGKDGTFRVELPPGAYDVQLEKQQRFVKGTLPALVQIRSGETTRLDIDIDTGIR